VKRQLHTPVIALTLTEALHRTIYAAGIECGGMSFLGFFVVVQFLASYYFIIFGYASNNTCLQQFCSAYYLVTTGVD
jgi:hypothetical protein